MRELLRQRGFRRLLFGQAVSSLGDWMGTLALLYFVLELSGSTTAVGGVLVLRLLPSALGAPLAARAVTRWNRRQVMLTSDLLRGGMSVALPIIPWLGWVYSWAFVMEIVSLAFLPARDSAIPVLLGKRNKENGETNTLALANGVTMGTQYGMIPLGAGVFGLVLLASNQMGWVGHWQYVVVFWLNAASYLVSYFAIRGIPDLDAPPDDEQDDRAADQADAPAGEPRDGRRPAEPAAAAAERRESEGFFDALRIPTVRAILPGIAVVTLGLGSLFSLGVVFVKEVLHAGPIGFGVLVALFGVGAALGLTALRRGTGGNLCAQIRLAIVAQGAVIGAMGFLATEMWAYLGAVLFGASATAGLVGGITLLQESLTGVQRNLALTAFHATLRGGLAIAALISGAAADLVGRVHLGPLGTLEPAQTVLMGSGAVIFLGSLLVRSVQAPPCDAPDMPPAPAARERPEGRPEGKVQER